MNRGNLLSQSTDNEESLMFSISGAKSFRISRRPSLNSNVFPIGFMGNNEPEQCIPERDTRQPDDTPVKDSVPDQADPELDDIPLQDAGDEAPVVVEPSDEPELGASIDTPTIMYQYSGSNIQRNPLTGSGCNDEMPVTGRRRVGSTFGYKRML